jgi:hypothetical protein
VPWKLTTLSGQDKRLPLILQTSAMIFNCPTFVLENGGTSGTRIGADKALTYFLSWYEKVDLNTPQSVREGSMWATDPELIRQRQELAHSHVNYAQTEVFVRDICEWAKDVDAEDAEGSESSQGEEETEDRGNARTCSIPCL